MQRQESRILRGVVREQHPSPLKQACLVADLEAGPRQKIDPILERLIPPRESK
jgi:hypothetical protein